MAARKNSQPLSNLICYARCRPDISSVHVARRASGGRPLKSISRHSSSPAKASIEIIAAWSPSSSIGLTQHPRNRFLAERPFERGGDLPHVDACASMPGVRLAAARASLAVVGWSVAPFQCRRSAPLLAPRSPNRERRPWRRQPGS